MISEPGPRLVVELVHAVAVLALPASAQAGYINRAGLAPLLDELALRLSDLAPLTDQFLGKGWLTAREAAIVVELAELLTGLSTSGDKSLWHLDSLGGQEWTEIREYAAEFFVGHP
ncbi:MAG: hypothetical protein GY926_20645 [bacterium]|nr:hypothetical protein [bacterium]